MARWRRLVVWLVLILGPATARAQVAPGVVVGWDSSSGATLLGELNCLACHEAPGATLPRKQAPQLIDVGGRVTPQFLRAFLANPQQLKPGSAMPDLLHGLPDQNRAETVEALTHYLVAQGGPIEQKGHGSTLSTIARGQELFHTVGCVACHAPTAAPPKHKRDGAQQFDDDDDAPKVVSVKQSVPFGDLATKTTLTALAKFIADPLHARPSGRMPSLKLDKAEAVAIAAFLLRDQLQADSKASGIGLSYEIVDGQFKQVPDFNKLKIAAKGDVGHIELAGVLAANKRKTDKMVAVRFFGMIDIPEDGAYQFWTASDDGSILRIGGRVVVNNDGSHPVVDKEGTVQLKKGRHPFELSYMNSGGGGELAAFWRKPGAKMREPLPDSIFSHDNAAAMVPKNVVDFQPDPAQAQKGKALFASLGCASCHQTEAAPKESAVALKAPALKALNPTGKGGCLDANVAVQRPRFALSAEQRAALQKIVADSKGGGIPEGDAHASIDRHLNAFSCYSCHARDGKGGPDKQRSDYFTYEVIVDLGDEGRLPPMLSAVGAKLTPAGFEDALFSGKRYRSSMATRMPMFGKGNVGHLPEAFAKADEGRIPKYTMSTSKSHVADGRSLVGSKALACINCHAWGSYRLPGAEGLDLLEAPRRLRPEWFHTWLANPSKIRPGTRMPTAWPDGKSFFPRIQDGDADRQMDAIFAYLKAGDKGGLPQGLSGFDGNILVVQDEPIVFRTFLSSVGAHAILVGFPQRTNVAFDAQRIRMAKAWAGDFISTKAAWEGRAGNYASIPGVSIVDFPAGPPITRLASITDPWPTDPAKKKGVSQIPEGWRFLGYRYDAKRIPTFLYRVGDIDVEETPMVELRPKGAFLIRQLRLSAATPPTDLYFRAAAGKTISQTDAVFRTDKNVDYRIVGGMPQVRPVEGGQELIVPIRFQPDPTAKSNVANLTIEIAW